jgi:hypothetical protein
MSDLFILYFVCCYFFHAGMLTVMWNELCAQAKIGGIVSFIMSPITLPFTLGVLTKP